ncbi:hypothetical protein E4K66_30935 [Bradyrhizobium frederickii]|uniref:Uncharacterized protein n=1 Tax=Bradyrhizobium frederickii TaxID=2560054 RepID=A0A4Y9KT93_9BRAD|nr:HEPN domain-containing protein [Bradyrhizobium frederickii]TFV34581.1 hypothetical protein E4K66_30935 [Bradyrhizobium frederickii]
MVSSSSDPDSATAQKEAKQYFDLFVAAFDELHSAVIKQVNAPGQYLSAHHDYPVMSLLDSGFPRFSESGFYDSRSPRNYVGTVRPGLGGLLSGLAKPSVDLPKGSELASFLRSHAIGKRLGVGLLGNIRIGSLVEDAVERYLHLYGLTASIEAKRRNSIIRSLALGTVFRTHNLRLVVPIAMTHFEADRFPLTDTTYIARIPRKLQLARARMGTRGSGAEVMVVGAATHAFVSNGWSIDADDVDGVRTSLGQLSTNVLDAADTFFGALRVATGISTGYAQVLWIPKGWTLDYFCDLPPVYGTTVRRYPGEYDNYGWSNSGAIVTAADLKDVRRIYKAAANSSSEAIRLALKRLSGCLTRTDEADAILDGTIGLELLLGDDENQALSYKLRLRAAALAMLQADPAHPPAEIASKVKQLYKARSVIVHGRRMKASKKASEPSDASRSSERLLASDLLRFVLNVLLAHPQYQDDPAKIDAGLLLRGDESVGPPIAARSKKDGGSRGTAPRFEREV